MIRITKSPAGLSGWLHGELLSSEDVRLADITIDLRGARQEWALSMAAELGEMLGIHAGLNNPEAIAMIAQQLALSASGRFTMEFGDAG